MKYKVGDIVTLNENAVIDGVPREYIGVELLIKHAEIYDDGPEYRGSYGEGSWYFDEDSVERMLTSRMPKFNRGEIVAAIDSIGEPEVHKAGDLFTVARVSKGSIFGVVYMCTKLKDKEDYTIMEHELRELTPGDQPFLATQPYNNAIDYEPQTIHFEKELGEPPAEEPSDEPLLEDVIEHDNMTAIDGTTLVASPDGGKKSDSGKLMLHLIDPEFLDEMAFVLTKGAEKYSAMNWQGLEKDRVLGSLLRHANEYAKGIKDDPSYPFGKHLAAVAVNAMFLAWMDRNDKGGEVPYES